MSENYIKNLAVQNLSNEEEQIRHVKIAERVCILSYFHTTYKSMENLAQALNFIVCTQAIHFRDYLHFAEPCFDVR